MDLFHVIILSIVEGITEFLPISSTGHLILTSKLLGILSTDFLKTFEIAIQSGAVLAVVNLYWRKIVKDPALLFKAFLGLIPTAIVGVTMYPILKSVLLESTQITAFSLFIGGIVIVAFDRYFEKREKNKKGTLSEVTYKQAFFTGLTQSLAIIPGVSRALSSIFGGMFFGLNKKTATEFSFILALPTILAASGFDLLKSASGFNGNQLFLLVIGAFISFIVAMFSIKWLLKYISTHSFITFGWYRIVVGIIFLVLLS